MRGKRIMLDELVTSVLEAGTPVKHVSEWIGASVEEPKSPGGPDPHHQATPATSGHVPPHASLSQMPGFRAILSQPAPAESGRT